MASCKNLPYVFSLLAVFAASTVFAGENYHLTARIHNDSKYACVLHDIQVDGHALIEISRAGRINKNESKDIGVVYSATKKQAPIIVSYMCGGNKLKQSVTINKNDFKNSGLMGAFLTPTGVSHLVSYTLTPVVED